MSDSKRLQLQILLEELLGSGNVYFQPPPNISMNYPCIVYSREHIAMWHADNSTYHKQHRYKVTVIDKNPDSEIPDRMTTLPRCSYATHFTSGNLNHDVFSLYY